MLEYQADAVVVDEAGLANLLEFYSSLFDRQLYELEETKENPRRQCATLHLCGDVMQLEPRYAAETIFNNSTSSAMGEGLSALANFIRCTPSTCRTTLTVARRCPKQAVDYLWTRF